MSEHDLPPIDPDLERMLAIEQGGVDVPHGIEARLATRLNRTLGTSIEVPAPTPAGAAAQAPTVPRWALPLTFVAGCVVGAFGWEAARPGTPAPEPVTVEPPARHDAPDTGRLDAGTVTRDAPAANDAMVTAVREERPRPEPDRARGTNPAGPAAPTAPTAASGQEHALLVQAQAALAHGRIGDAMRALDEHAERFASSSLREERDALRVQALAAQGNPRAVEAAESFLRRYPTSIFREAVEAIAR